MGGLGPEMEDLKLGARDGGLRGGPEMEGLRWVGEPEMGCLEWKA